jgi:hypothetical protein
MGGTEGQIWLPANPSVPKQTAANKEIKEIHFGSTVRGSISIVARDITMQYQESQQILQHGALRAVKETEHQIILLKEQNNLERNQEIQKFIQFDHILEEKISELITQRSRVFDLENQLVLLRETADEAQKLQIEHKLDSQRLIHQVGLLEKENDELKLRTQNQHLREKELLSRIAEKDSRIQALEDLTQTKAIERDELVKNISDLEEEREALSSQREKDTAEILAITQQYTESQLNLQDALRAIKELEHELNFLQQQNSDLEEKLLISRQASSETLSELKTENTRLINHLEESEARKSNIEEASLRDIH